MKLYISAASSFSRKIRVMLIEKNVPHGIEIINLWEPNDLKETNPVGKVPALKLDDGRVLISSPLIADYVDSRFPNPRFLPADPDLRFEARRWEAFADGTMEAVSASLYEMRFHDEAQRSQAWLDRQRGKIDAGFTALERMLGGRPWCVGSAMSVADLAVACHIGFITLRAPQFFPQGKYPRLAAHSKNMEARESMKKTAPPPA
jgi:glutathione S-transferase